MKRLSARKFIKENGLCEGVKKVSGIYAITIDNRIVYIGQAINMESRTRKHIRHMINGYQREKYALLNAVRLLQHNVDCREVKECDKEELAKFEHAYIQNLFLPLNTLLSNNSPKPKELTPEELLKMLDKCEEWKSDMAIPNC